MDNSELSRLLAKPSTPQGESERESLDDLFEVPQPEDNDIYTDDLLEVDEEEGIGDLLTVSREDIINGGDKPKPKVQYERTSKPFIPPKVSSIRRV